MAQKLTVAFGGLAAALYAKETVIFTTSRMGGRRIVTAVVGVLGLVSATAVTCSLAAQAERQRGEHVGDEDGGLDGADSGPVPDGSPRRDERGKGSEQRSAAAVKRRKPKKKQAVSAGFFDRASSQKEKTPQASSLNSRSACS